MSDGGGGGPKMHLPSGPPRELHPYGGGFGVLDLADAIAGVHEHDRRPVRRDLALLDRDVGGDDHGVTHRRVVRGGAVDTADAAAALTLDQVRREARAVRDIVDVDPLEADETARLHQSDVEGEAAFVLEVRLGHLDPVDLGTEHLSLHRSLLRCTLVAQSRPWFTRLFLQDANTRLSLR